jgi:hypothetical protein
MDRQLVTRTAGARGIRGELLPGATWTRLIPDRVKRPPKIHTSTGRPPGPLLPSAGVYTSRYRQSWLVGPVRAGLGGCGLLGANRRGGRPASRPAALPGTTSTGTCPRGTAHRQASRLRPGRRSGPSPRPRRPGRHLAGCTARRCGQGRCASSRTKPAGSGGQASPDSDPDLARLLAWLTPPWADPAQTASPSPPNSPACTRRRCASGSGKACSSPPAAPAAPAATASTTSPGPRPGRSSASRPGRSVASNAHLTALSAFQAACVSCRSPVS